VIGFSFLGIMEYPSIDPPVISVRTSYTGANADIIESQLTEPLEKAINGIAGIRSISSSSNQGVSNITVEFNLSVDLEAAANDVRDKVSQAVRQLPQDIDAPPVVSKADANSDPIISMTLLSHTRSLLEVSDYGAPEINIPYFGKKVKFSFSCTMTHSSGATWTITEGEAILLFRYFTF
jgi:multidrug efflux pump